jgi:cytochrome oxidase Cu insertion factor (SCO1/SenC/PrrC family)
MNTKLLRVFLIVSAAIATGLYIYAKKTSSNHLPADQIIGAAHIGGPFKLMDQNRQIKTDKDLLGKYAVIYFGYTFCPDVCPMGMHSFSQALSQLPELQGRIQPVFISVDPKRDKPEEIKNFLKTFHPSFWGLTGEVTQIDQAKEAFKVYAVQQKNEHGSEHYLIDHSSIFYVFGPDGDFIGHFTHATPVDEMVKKLNEWAVE